MRNAKLLLIRSFFIGISLVILTSGLLGMHASALGQSTEYDLPSDQAPQGPDSIALGSDGAMWFVGQTSTFIGKISSDGTITQFPLGDQEQITAITSGSDGALWYTVYDQNYIGRITTAGNITKYYVSDTPESIVSDPNGNLWFTNYQSKSVSEMSTNGTLIGGFTLQNTTADSNIASITTGADGSIWYTRFDSDGNGDYDASIGRYAPDGQVTEYPVPAPGNLVGGYGPHGIIQGYDGNIWFTTQGYITSFNPQTNSFSEYPTQFPNAAAYELMKGPDNAVWFTIPSSADGTYRSLVGAITSAGGITYISTPPIAPYNVAGAEGIALGSDGNIWYTENFHNAIVKLVPPSVLIAAPTNLSANSPTSVPSLSWDAVQGAASYNIYRNGVDIASTTTPSFADTSALEGVNDYYVTAVIGSNESDPSNTVSVLVDKTSPTLTDLTWSSDPLREGQDTTLSVNASDAGSGINNVSYAVNGSPTQSMAYNSSTGLYQTSFGSNLAAGTYTVSVTATDNAGNTSTLADVLAVYVPTTSSVKGHAKIQPTASDVLPIALDTSKNPANLVLGFTNATSPASGSFTIDYSVKKNYNDLDVTSNAIDWVVIPDNTHASILGQATLTAYVNGVKMVVPNVTVRYDITIGSTSTVSVKIFAPGVNPSSGTPEYTINNTVIPNGSNLMLHP